MATNRTIPRLLLAGVSSGCGKTTVSCAVLQALVNRGVRTAAFKCGPDYIDPMFHSRAIGVPSRNLDPFFMEENTLRYLLSNNAEGFSLAVVEGVMGYYDGAARPDRPPQNEYYSTHQVAAATGTPTILVINGKGMSQSILAVLHGFLTYRPDSCVVGVILNQVSSGTYASIRRAIEAEFQGRVRAYGYLPKLPTELLFESRHLGLITADEVADLRRKLQQLAAQAEQTLDLDAMLALAGQAGPIVCTQPVVPVCSAPVRIAVAQDRAFCFYYQDSLALLEQMGAQLVPFSPLEDRALPAGIDGMLLGGGYPELYADPLSANVSMRASIRSALTAGLPCVAECGGFLYLNRTLDGREMVGFLGGDCANAGRLSRFGYVTLTARRDNLLCAAGAQIRGHEFHYYDCTQNGDAYRAERAGGRGWDCVVATDRLYAGFPHLHFYANPAFALRFCEACADRKRRLS